MKKILISIGMIILMAFTFSGCSRDSDVASYNLSKQADMFQINRRVIFYNGITSEYILSIQGYCSIKDSGSQLEVTCKTGEGAFKKHFLGLSDNVTYFAEQLENSKAGVYHYEVVFKPSVIIPDVDFR